MRRVAIVASHPIQYQAPWFQALAGVCDLTVFFCHRQDADGQARAGFGVAFDWDVPLLDGYRFEWLENVAADPGVERFAGCDTPSVEAGLALGDFDACIVNGWYLKSYVQAIRACRRLGVPLLMRGDSHLNSPRPLVWRAAKYLPYRWLVSRADAHLHVGQANREYLAHYGVPADRLFFVPHFVDNGRFAAAAAAAHAVGEVGRLRAAWKAGPDATVFVFAGKLIALKRVVDFVEAVAAAARTHAVRGVVVGAGPEDAALRRRAAELGAPVHFEGFHNQSTIASRYAAADCLVLPSGRESWGLVINEAMAAGRPAIVSDAVGCAPDLIDAGRTGWVFPVGDVDALAARMVSMAEQLARDRSRVEADVRRRIGTYSCAAAVQGTMQAVEAVLAPADRARKAQLAGAPHG